MQLQDLSFKLDNEYIVLDNDVKLSIEVFSFDNVFHPRKESLKKVGNKYISHELIWGGSEFEPNSFVELEVGKENNTYSFNLKAGLNQKVRETKLRFDNLPLGNLISTINCYIRIFIVFIYNTYSFVFISLRIINYYFFNFTSMIR